MLIIIGVVSEIVVLFVLQHKPITHKSREQPSLGTLFPKQRITSAVFGDLPIGYYIATSSDESFFILGMVNDIYRNKQGDVDVDVSFGLNRGAGSQVQKTFLLYTSDKYIHGMLLRKANSLSATLLPKDQKTIALDPVMDPNGTLVTLKKYLHQKAIFSLWNTLYPPGSKPPTVNSAAETQGRLHTLVDCNKSLLSALDNGQGLPTCTPYVELMTVYDPNF